MLVQHDLERAIGEKVWSILKIELAVNDPKNHITRPAVVEAIQTGKLHS